MNPPSPDLVAAIDRRLPQTQCAQCGYPNCLEYAQALAAGRAGLNQCPPGGEATIDALSRLLGRPAEPLSPAHGPRQPLQLAFIREAECIGCKRCIAACPVDCIVGAARLMHTVIAEDCSGCRLCLPVCPTDCIELTDPPPGYGAGAPSVWPEFSHRQVEKARRRARQKRHRRAQLEARRAHHTRERRREAMRREIAAAVERKRRHQAKLFVPAPAAGAPRQSLRRSP